MTTETAVSVGQVFRDRDTRLDHAPRFIRVMELTDKGAVAIVQRCTPNGELQGVRRTRIKVRRLTSRDYEPVTAS